MCKIWVAVVLAVAGLVAGCGGGGGGSSAGSRGVAGDIVLTPPEKIPSSGGFAEIHGTVSAPANVAQLHGCARLSNGQGGSWPVNMQEDGSFRLNLGVPVNMDINTTLTYTVWAEATDNSGGLTKSNEITFQVPKAQPPPPPF